jgi:hypothetical protein
MRLDLLSTMHRYDGPPLKACPRPGRNARRPQKQEGGTSDAADQEPPAGSQQIGILKASNYSCPACGAKLLKRQSGEPAKPGEQGSPEAFDAAGRGGKRRPGG